MLQCLQRNISNFVQSDTLLNIYIYTTIEHFLFCHNKYSHKILLCGKEKKFFTRRVDFVRFAISFHEVLVLPLEEKFHSTSSNNMFPPIRPSSFILGIQYTKKIDTSRTLREPRGNLLIFRTVENLLSPISISHFPPSPEKFNASFHVRAAL